MGLFWLNWKSKSTELGYWLDPEMQNQGIMTKSLIQVVEWLTEEFGFQTFQIKCAQGNLPSQRVAIKNGFEWLSLEKRENKNMEEVFFTFQRSKKPGS